MYRLTLQTNTGRERRSRDGIFAVLLPAILFVLGGCAQFDQFIEKLRTSDNAQPTSQSVEQAPAHPAAEQSAAPAKEPVAAPAVKNQVDQPPPASAVKEPSPPPTPAVAGPSVPAADVAKPPEPAPTDQEKALAEKQRLKEEQKSHAAADKKSKKSKKSTKARSKPQPATEDTFLPPIPMPSKPAAIGGSGG